MNGVYTTLTQLPGEVQDALSRGEPVFPLAADKTPLVRWKPFQQRLPTAKELRGWIRDLDIGGWARVTGAASGLVVLDFDLPAVGLLVEWNLAPHLRTTSGGYHVLLRHPGWRVRTLNSRTSDELGRRWPGLDSRADGGYSAIWRAGGGYTWLREAVPDALDVLPAEVRAFFGLDRPPAPKPVTVATPVITAANPTLPDRLLRDALLRVSQGHGRDNSAFWLGCQMRDNRFAESEAHALGASYCAVIPPVNTKGELEEFTVSDYEKRVTSAYGSPPREPWAPPSANGQARIEKAPVPTDRDVPPAARTTLTPPALALPSEPATASSAKTKTNPAATAAPDSAGDRESEAAGDDDAQEEAPDSAGDTPGSAPQDTDLGNAYRLADRYGAELLYCDVWGGWLRWDDTRWQRDRTRDAETLAHETIEHLFHSAWKIEDKKEAEARAKFALKCQSDKAISAMVRRARALPRFKSRPEDFDGRPMLFNCTNGTLDLETGKLSPHRREDRLTQLCGVPYDADATAPLWNRFLLDVMADKEHLVAFLQRAIGYSLTGSDREKTLFLLWGPLGDNGKSTLLDIIRKMMGDYGHKLRRETLMARRLEIGRACPEIAGLRGKRFAYVSETEEGGRLDEATVKELTGREWINTRNLYEKESGFPPEFTLWLGTNHKPVVHGTDGGIWSRLPLLPFLVKFVDGPADQFTPENLLLKPMDKKLPEKLLDELPGILAWSVRGCLEWQQSGLQIPEEIVEATKTYRNESDFIEAFLQECCVRVDGLKCRMRDAHERYARWAPNSGAPVLSQRMLTPLIEAKGYSHETGTGNAAYWIGLALQDESGQSRYGGNSPD